MLGGGHHTRKTHQKTSLAPHRRAQGRLTGHVQRDWDHRRHPRGVRASVQPSADLPAAVHPKPAAGAHGHACRRVGDLWGGGSSRSRGPRPIHRRRRSRHRQAWPGPSKPFLDRLPTLVRNPVIVIIVIMVVIVVIVIVVAIVVISRRSSQPPHVFTTRYAACAITTCRIDGVDDCQRGRFRLPSDASRDSRVGILHALSSRGALSRAQVRVSPKSTSDGNRVSFERTGSELVETQFAITCCCCCAESALH